MKQIISVRDLEELLRNGKGLNALPQDVLLTPSARDFLREHESTGAREPVVQTLQAGPGVDRKVSATSSKADLEAFFNSAPLHELKLQLCDIGRRLWQRAYVDGNGGNIAIRVGEDIALCTPTLVSKGFMKPEDMCLVDLEGNGTGTVIMDGFDTNVFITPEPGTVLLLAGGFLALLRYRRTAVR